MAAVTKQTIEAAWRNRTKGQRPIRDDVVRGLVLALHDAHATWRLEYRLPGVNPESGHRWPNQVWTIGRLAPALHLAEARAHAREGKVKVARGIDLAGEHRAALQAQLVETAAAVRTVATLVDAYTAARARRWRPSTAKAFDGDLRTITNALGSIPYDKATRRTLAGFLRDFVDRAQTQGHRGTRVERLRCSAAFSCSRLSVIGSK